MVQTKTSLLLYTLAATFAPALSSQEARIIGGKNAVPGKYEYFVQLERGCGGSLISPDMLITAAQ